MTCRIPDDLQGLLAPYAKVARRTWGEATTLGVGLGSFLAVAPDSVENLKNTIQILNNKQVKSFVIGSGSNLIGTDDALGGVVLDLCGSCQGILQEGEVFVVGAAVPMLQFARHAAVRGYGGFAALSGIPGQLGGLVSMNAGALGQEICSNILELRGLLHGSEWSWRPPAEAWGYRHCALPPGVVLTQVVMKCVEVIPEEELEKISLELARRARVTPRGRSAGSVFQNPPGGFAGELLEKSGCKGLQIGGLRVSEQHANWIVRSGRGPASEADCLRLVDTMQSLVQEHFGIMLKAEWRWARDLLSPCP